MHLLRVGQPGLHFLGLPWLHAWGSGRLSGVARDAMFLAEQIEGAMGVALGEPQRVACTRMARSISGLTRRE
jgi:hypothetical protein